MINNLPLKLEQYAVPAVIAILALLAYFLSPSLADLLNYQRQLAHSDYWRLITAHFLHTNHYHLLLNVAALTLLWALHGHFYTVKNYTVVFIFSSVFSAMGIHYFSLDITHYVGLSGTLHGIFMWGAMLDIYHKEKTGYLLLLAGWLKIAHEQFYGASEDVASLIDARVAIDAHLFGALAGIIMGSLLILKMKKSYK